MIGALPVAPRAAVSPLSVGGAVAVPYDSRSLLRSQTIAPATGRARHAEDPA